MSLTDLQIPIAVLYAGLAGCVLALIVATIQNRWSPKVFFLLALRLAIGWHFLFEGLHKVHSVYVGPSESNRPFTSEPYFSLAEGPLGPLMRKQAGDIDKQLADKLTPQNVPKNFADLPANVRAANGLPGASDEDFARMAPPEVVREWNEFVAAFAEKYKLTDADKKRLDGTLDDAERAELAAAKELGETADDKKKEELAKKAGPGDLTVAALAAYGRWVVGVEPRNSKVKYVSGDTPLTGPQRLDYIAHRKAELDELEKRAAHDLGVGYGLEQTRAKDMRGLVSLAKSTLLADADAFLIELKKDTFATIIDPRFEKAPPPGIAIGYEKGKKNPRPADLLQKNQDKLAPLFPPPAAPNPVAFDAVPPPVKTAWENLNAAFRAAYPIPEDKVSAVDEAYAGSKARLANWYFDRDEFSGQPKPGFGKVVKDYQDKVKVAGSVNAAAARAEGFAKRVLDAAAKQADLDATTAQDAVPAALDAKFADLRKALTAAVPTEVTEGPTGPVKKDSPFEKLDWRTRWGLVAIGAMLLAGLFTRIACLAGAAFLVMTYLAHPPFPWLPLPPGTEGNPLFVNKNVIECLALLTLMTFPTGRWMGLDAFIHRIIFRRSAEYNVPKNPRPA